MRALLITLLAGCLGPDPRPSDALPHVRVTAAQQRPEYLAGAEAWSALGFDVAWEDSAGRQYDECPDEWHTEHTAEAREWCQLTIAIRTDPALIEKYGSDGVTFPRSRIVWLDDSVEDHNAFYRAKIVGHEVGHIVLSTAFHGNTGVLGPAYDHMMPVLDPSDYEIACLTIDVCF